MDFYKVNLLLIVSSVLAEVLWYPANILNTPLMKTFYPNGMLNKKIISSNEENNTNSTKDNAKLETPLNEIKSNVNRKNNLANTFHEAEHSIMKQKSFDFNSTINLLPRTYFTRHSDMTLLSRADEDKKSRFLDVFQVVEFAHAACTSSTGLEGKCLHEYECQSTGGSPMGSCADGFGICCVIVYPCFGQISSPVGWFTNPEYPLPSTDRLSCALTVDKTSQDIKQIRLDFTIFELLPPVGGTCEHDQFIVSSWNVNNIIPILCGINTGQHIYVEVGDTKGPLRLTLQTVTAENRLFCIKVTQLTRSDILAAPAGCLQYFNGPNAVIESFNYRNISEVEIPTHQSYLNNLNYAICIERESASCSITYTNDDEMQIVNYDTDGLPIIPPRQAGVEIFNCPSDWLLISAVRLCGERLNDGSVLQDFYLNAPVTDISAGPITIWFRSDEGYVGRGFKIQYQQNACAQ